MPTRPRRVALFLDSSLGYGSRILDGIGLFVQSHSHWRPIYQDLPVAWLADQISKVEADGIIYTCLNPEIEEAARARGLPAVNVTGAPNEVPPVSVIGDDAAIGTLAADYFLDRGFTHFACLHFASRRFTRVRHAAFVQRVLKAGFETSSFTTEQALVDTITQTPVAGTLAVFVTDDVLAARLLGVCYERRVGVPGTLAVLGAGDWRQMCALSSPPLSSVDVDLERRGLEAARLLDRMLAGGASPDEPMLISPRGVITRRSTDVYAYTDPEVTEAMRFIAAHADEPIGVEDVVDAVALSRRTLEGRFLRHVGRTIHHEIWRRHVDHARLLLTSTSLSMMEVALRSGFGSAASFSIVFRRMVGMSPSAYRRQGDQAAGRAPVARRRNRRPSRG